MVRKQNLGQLLVQGGYLTPPELTEYLEVATSQGRRLGEVLVEKDVVTQDVIQRLLENQHRVEFVDLESIVIDPDVIALVNPAIAKKNVLAPVKLDNEGVLHVAIEDPRNFKALDEVRTITRKQVRPMMAAKASIERFIERAYTQGEAQRAVSEYIQESAERVVEEAVVSEADIHASPIVRLVNSIMDQAVQQRASDIHIEPLADTIRVRYRIDGILRQVQDAPISTLPALIARIKIMGGLNIAEKRVPQDGRFAVKAAGKEVDIRLSTVNTTFGEKAVMRLLDKANFMIPKEQLGFTEENLKKFDQLLSSPHGIILVAGPTGSGKSTTLYSMLNEINTEDDNLSSVEDPVEFQMPGINQIQVNVKAGVTFAAGLRALLRQDPDIIMIGEIRDPETVEIAIRSAITGHLVLSTIHTNDAVSTIVRLEDMNVPSYLIAASLEGVISQRLLRRICENCKDEYTMTESEAEEIGLDLSLYSDATFFKGTGCAQCRDTGYRGRMAVHEVLIVNSEIREMIHKKRPLAEIQDAAVRQGMVTLKDSAIKHLVTGRTTVSEVASILHGV